MEVALCFTFWIWIFFSSKAKASEASKKAMMLISYFLLELRVGTDNRQQQRTTDNKECRVVQYK